MTVTVPQRREGESDLDYLRRKETSWGLWQADALERIEQQDQTIDAMQARIEELESTLSAAKTAAEAVAKLMGGLHGDPDYLKGKNTCRHTDMRSRAPRAKAVRA